MWFSEYGLIYLMMCVWVWVRKKLNKNSCADGRNVGCLTMTAHLYDCRTTRMGFIGEAWFIA